MRRLSERIAIAERPVASLATLADKSSLTDVERDAAIQRFEYSFEAVWKAGQRYLKVVEGIEAGSPKQTVRGCFDAGLLDEGQAQKGLAMADDRKLTVHTYNEELARQITSRLPAHAALLAAWLTAIAGKVRAAG